MKNDAWLAGFTDGEGSFNICCNSGGGLIPRFKISLRADDLAVLEDLHAHFGGFISALQPKDACPAVQWVVSGKRDVAGLVAYFDRFPLRAKKARDYLIWRRAVSAYCRSGGKATELPALRAALMTGRQFEAPEEIVPVADVATQLRLVYADRR